MWVLDRQRDLIADFRAIFHLGRDEALALDASEYMALAWRAIAYRGAMYAAAQREQDQQKRDVRNPDLAELVEFG